MENIANHVLDLIYPPTCWSCSRLLVLNEKDVCSYCLSNVPLTGFESNPQIHQTAIRFYGKLNSPNIYSLLKYRKGNITQRLLYAFKYKNQPQLASLFADLQFQQWQTFSTTLDYDMLVAVPLHPSKLSKRGYNQSLVYAQALSERTGIPFNDSFLKRTKASRVQAFLNRLNRQENVKSIYALAQPESISGKKILLVDDVITTGATMEVCTQLLNNAGANHVDLCSIATSIF